MQTPPAAVEAKSLPFHSCFIVDWLQSNFYIGDNGTLSKLAVYKEYCRLCEKNNWKPVACAVLGKLVHKAFPNIVSKRRGPRGAARQHYIGLNYRDPTKRTSICPVVPPASYSQTQGLPVKKKQHPLLPAPLLKPEPQPSVPCIFNYSEGEHYWPPDIPDPGLVTAHLRTLRGAMGMGDESFGDLEGFLQYIPEEEIHTTTLLTTTTTTTTIDNNNNNDTYGVSPFDSAETENINENNLEKLLPTSPIEESPATKLDRAFRRYYEELLLAVLLERDQIQELIKRFWLHEIKEKFFPTFAHSSLWKDEILAYESRGINFLMGQVLKYPAGWSLEEQSYFLANMARMLPIWVQAAASVVVSTDIFIAQMDLWARFSWELSRPVQFGLSGISDSKPVNQTTKAPCPNIQKRKCSVIQDYSLLPWTGGQ